MLNNSIERADHRKVRVEFLVEVGLSATVTSTSPNDRRGNVENVTLAKLVNGPNCDGRLGNERDRSRPIMRNGGVLSKIMRKYERVTFLFQRFRRLIRKIMCRSILRYKNLNEI